VELKEINYKSKSSNGRTCLNVYGIEVMTFNTKGRAQASENKRMSQMKMLGKVPGKI
jgi:hypothetical protein